MEPPPIPPPWKQVLRSERESVWLLADLPDLDTYPHWEDLLAMDPPEGLTREQWWVRLKGLRHEKAVTVPGLSSGTGQRLWYSMTPLLRTALDDIRPEVRGEDPEVGRQVASAEGDQFVEWTLREEAIASAQLAGVQLNRSEALTAFDDGTIRDTPAGAAAWGVYLALTQVIAWRGEELTPERVVEVNRLMTGDGALRTATTDIADPYGQVWHSAPPVEEIDDRLRALCDFVNRGANADERPLLHATIAHWMAVNDQYFAEANNRTARLLWYWALLRAGYWLARHLSVSKVMLAREHDYRRAFLLTDTDEGDLTYFFHFSVSALHRALWHLRARLESELQTQRPTRSPLLDVEQELSRRQLKVLETCLADPRSAFTYETHAVYWSITRETARADLRGLGRRGLLVRVGETTVWQAPDDLTARLRGEAPARVEMGESAGGSGAVVPAHQPGPLQQLWRFVRGLQG